jgi:hypothetical protein
VDDGDVRRWFDDYLGVLAACGRGETDVASLLTYYGVPMLFATDDAPSALTTDNQVLAFAQQQVDGMRATDYHHSEVLSSDVSVLNCSAALHRGSFARQRADGSEISRLTVTYLVTDGPLGRRISGLVIHTT